MFTRMVVEVYRQLGWVTTISEYLKLYREDREFAPHGIFVAIRARKSGDMVATFRMTLRENGLRLPFETFFGVSIEQLCREIDIRPRQIWHCGRIAVDKDRIQQLGYSKSDSYALLKSLIRYMYQIGQGENLFEGENLFLGENYEKTQRLYNMLGFPMRPCRAGEYFKSALLYAAYMKTSDAPMYNWLLDSKAV